MSYVSKKMIGVLFGAFKRGELKVNADEMKEIYKYAMDDVYYKDEFYSRNSSEISYIINAVEDCFKKDIEEMNNRINKFLRFIDKR